MCLIKNDHGVLVVNFKVFSDLLVDQVVVGHEDEVGACDSIFGGIVRAVVVLDRLLVNLFDVHWLPGHLGLSIVSVLVETAWVDAVLGRSASRVQGKTFVHVYLLIHTQMVP